jgi:DnaK suppressor protein
MLNEKQSQELKETLEKEAGELEAQLSSVSKAADFGSDVETDFSQEADEAEEFANKLGLQDTLKERLQSIEEALDKMNRGEYGKCENCGKDISFELLKVNPESKLCKDCKSE